MRIRWRRSRAKPRAQDLNTEVEEVVRVVTEQLQAGQVVDYTAIESQHPDLQPELGNRLSRLRAIEEAAEKAKQQPETGVPTGQPPTPLQDDLAFLSEALESYDILEPIEYGGQGVVYHAIQRSTKRLVAVKVLLDGPLATDRQRHRFAREIELVSRMQHPNIAVVYESGTVRGRPFFAMEFVDGLPIDDYVLLNALNVVEVVRLFQIVCLAVSSAHQHGVIHRDLKPANILVDEGGQPHILDFGLAKEIAGSADRDTATRVSVTGHVVGTLPYLSPEQAAGQSGGMDVRSDIYTLGVVLFESLADSFPYPVVGDRQEVLDNICSREPLPLRKALARRALDEPTRAADVNDDLERIVLKALDKDKDRRYQSAAALADDLGRFLAGDAVEARAASRLYLLKKTARKFRIHLAISAAFVLLLVAALATVTTAWQRAERVARIAQAGLQMGSYLKLGSVHRDESRLDQAMAMFEKALEIADTVPASDPVVQRYRYSALHRLAELDYEIGDTDKADTYCQRAIELAEQMARQAPLDSEWQRQLGFSHVLRGRMAYSRKAWEQALSGFRQAAAIREELSLFYPNNVSLRSDLASAIEWQGSCCRRLNRLSEALQHYTEAIGTYRNNAELEPGVLDHEIDLIRAEIRLAVLYLSYRTSEDDNIAAEQLKRVEERLRTLLNSQESDAHRWEIEGMLEDVKKNQQLILRRATPRPSSPG